MIMRFAAATALLMGASLTTATAAAADPGDTVTYTVSSDGPLVSVSYYGVSGFQAYALGVRRAIHPLVRWSASEADHPNSRQQAWVFQRGRVMTVINDAREIHCPKPRSRSSMTAPPTRTPSKPPMSRSSWRPLGEYRDISGSRRRRSGRKKMGVRRLLTA